MRPIAAPSFTTIEIIVRIAGRSFFPQYCAESIAEPLARPKQTSDSIKNGLFARDEAERSAPLESAAPSIRVSAMLVACVITF